MSQGTDFIELINSRYETAMMQKVQILADRLKTTPNNKISEDEMKFIEDLVSSFKYLENEIQDFSRQIIIERL